MEVSQPLVSIVVITYNSAKYVLETLESAKAQTYQNIELIISDDGSQDETVELCEKWLAENKDRFIENQIITVEKNTGIPANCNRGVKASHGEWIKLIAGDDVLYNNGIETFVRYIKINTEANFVQSLVKTFGETLFVQKETTFPKPNTWWVFNTTTEKQIKYILKHNIIAAPGIYIKRSLVEKVGFFDDQFKMLEDLPMWFKILSAKEKIFFLKEVTVLYRRHSESTMISNAVIKATPFSNSFLKEILEVLDKYKQIHPIGFQKAIWKFKYHYFISKLDLKKNVFTDVINKILSII